MIPGDVISMSMTQIVVRADGKDQAYDRNQVKKILLVGEAGDRTDASGTITHAISPMTQC